eukprot:m.190624 g.190624  ORF g.190624 m.190624 type:complete len:521 (+) comp18072_c0_seq1:423-1985(+)
MSTHPGAERPAGSRLHTPSGEPDSDESPAHASSPPPPYTYEADAHGTAPTTAPSQPQTPLPLPQIATIFVLLFANAAVSTAPFPFLPFMVADLGVSVEQTGSAVGLIAGGRFFGNLACSWLWGLAADKWGRRPCILLSILCQCGATVFFAYSTSKSVIMAAVARTLGGALNGAPPIAKTYVGEITDSTNQGFAMTIITASWGAGLVIGPALGGFLSSLATKYPSMDTPLLRAWPYAPPMLIMAFICVIAAVLGWFFLEETLDRSQVAMLKARQADVEQNTKPDVTKGPETNAPACRACLPTLIQDPTRFTVVLLYAAISVQAIGFDEMYNVWLAAPIEAGGMGYTTDQIGLTLVFYGIATILLTAPVYQALEKRVGMITVFQWMAVATALCYFIMPLIPRAAVALGLERHSYVTYCCLIGTVTIAKVANGITFVIQAVFTNNSVDQLRRGTFNGLSMTIAAAVRSITPLFFGWTFGVTISSGHGWPLDSSLVFLLTALIMLHSAHICGGLPKSIETQCDR